MDINKLISEEITRYIQENTFGENSYFENESDSNDSKYKDIQRKAKTRDGKNVSGSDEDRLRNLLNTGLINISALAQEIYPDHTEEGAQSQLRKKIKGETNDNGSEYHIKERESAAIRRVLNKIRSSLA